MNSSSRGSLVGLVSASAAGAYASRNLDLGYTQTDTYQILLKGALKRDEET